MSKNIRQIVFPLLAAIIWGTAFVVQGDVADRIPPFFFNGIRFVIAGFALLFIILIREAVAKKKLKEEYEPPKIKKVVLGGVVCGVVLSVATNLQQWGITLGVSGGVSAFITALYMIIVPIIGIFLGKKTTLNVWIAAIIALPALYLVCDVRGFNFDLGTILTIGCAIFFAFHILVVDKFVQNENGFILSCVQFFVAGITSFICSLIFDKIDFAVIVECVPQILYVGLVSSAVGYTLQIEAQKGTNPTCVSLLLCLESLFALLVEAVVGVVTNNPIVYSPLRYVGCAIMLAAVIVSQVNFKSIKHK